jgi:hypothetical protein
MSQFWSITSRNPSFSSGDPLSEAQFELQHFYLALAKQAIL